MCIVFGIIWALWRRILGGWLHLRRSYIVASMFVLLLPLALTQSLWIYILVCSGSSLYWLMGHTFDKWHIVLRYPIVGIIYPITKKLWKNDWNIGEFIDGYTAVSELFIGFCFGVTLWFLFFV